MHRDVKPGNVLLSKPEDTNPPMRRSAGAAGDGAEPPNGSSSNGSAGGCGSGWRDAGFVYLIDFGIAANLLSTRHSSVLAGTAAYMAPERFTHGGDHRVDVYALGCMLFELLCARPPYDGDFMQLMGAHTHAPIPRLGEAASGAPAGLDDVVAIAMAKNPDHRYPSAGALAAAARAALTTPATGRPCRGGHRFPPVQRAHRPPAAPGHPTGRAIRWRTEPGATDAGGPAAPGAAARRAPERPTGRPRGRTRLALVSPAARRSSSRRGVARAVPPRARHRRGRRGGPARGGGHRRRGHLERAD